MKKEFKVGDLIVWNGSKKYKFGVVAERADISATSTTLMWPLELFTVHWFPADSSQEILLTKHDAEEMNDKCGHL